MGYWKDNFPGSEAYFLRIKIARGVVGYTVVLGGLLFAFSPFAKTVRKRSEESLEQDHLWLRDYFAKRMDGNTLSGPRSKEIMDKAFSEIDVQEHLDFTRTRKFQKELASFKRAEDQTQQKDE